MPRTPAVRTTMKDVARASGVSPATVSFVLNETPGQTIPVETRERVRFHAERLGYVPHRIARALREGHSRTVLLSTGSVPGGHGLESFIEGLDHQLARLGHTLLVVHGRPRSAVPADVLEVVAPRAVLDLAAAYPVAPPGGDGARAGADGPGDRPGAAAPAWEGGWSSGLAAHGETQLRHLVAQGHRRIAFAVGDDPTSAMFADLRRAQLEASARHLRVAAPVPLTLPSAAGGPAAAVGRLAEEYPDVTAVAALDDDTALRLLAGMADRGLRAPDDLAVIGFNEGLHGALWRPALTTVRIDAEAYGRRVAHQLLDLEPPAWSAPPSRVVVRDTA
ncbi:LacI family DNA-binding transcriptional regulator [Agromyces sp. SYSU T00194]|uniref:LacI family DNA-binding transcriptional regulator n=1 Tax=Agromyces chitinivorans TaxID=3158560 RepID=UPI003396D682